MTLTCEFDLDRDNLNHIWIKGHRPIVRNLLSGQTHVYTITDRLLHTASEVAGRITTLDNTDLKLLLHSPLPLLVLGVISMPLDEVHQRLNVINDAIVLLRVDK